MTYFLPKLGVALNYHKSKINRMSTLNDIIALSFIGLSMVFSSDHV